MGSMRTFTCKIVCLLGKYYGKNNNRNRQPEGFPVIKVGIIWRIKKIYSLVYKLASLNISYSFAVFKTLKVDYTFVGWMNSETSFKK